MFGWFSSPTFADPDLGELTRKRGLWRGVVSLGGGPAVPLALSGSRREPDPAALAATRELIAQFASWRPILERELFAHYGPYAEGLAAGDFEPGDRPFALLATPAEVWPHVTLEQVSVTPLDGVLTTELGYTTDWDEEHTLGARFQAGAFFELNGSILQP